MWPIDGPRCRSSSDGAVTGLGTNPRSMPDSTKYVPRVAITGGIRSFVTITPLTAPTPAPMASSIGTAASGLPSGRAEEMGDQEDVGEPHKGGDRQVDAAAARQDGGRARHAGDGERCQRRRASARSVPARERRLHDDVG